MGGYLLITSTIIARRRGYPNHTWQGLAERVSALRASIGALLLPVFIVVCLVGGIATVTEIGAIALLYAIYLSTLDYRQSQLQDIARVIAQAAPESARILCIIAVSGGALWIVIDIGLFQSLDTSLTGFMWSPTAFLLSIAVGLIVLGTVISPMLKMILVLPVLTLIIITTGIDVLQFAIVAILASSTGLITPLHHRWEISYFLPRCRPTLR